MRTLLKTMLTPKKRREKDSSVQVLSTHAGTVGISVFVQLNCYVLQAELTFVHK